VNGLVLRGAYGFFAGVCVAELLPRDLRKGPAWDVVGMTCAALFWFLLGHLPSLTGAWQEFALVGGLTPALIAACSHGTVLSRVTDWRPLVWLGNVSFSVYLWHFPVQICLALLVSRGWPIRYDTVGALAGFLVLTYVIGHLSWRWFEKPVQHAVTRSRLGRALAG
jgi:peptidoglycan/LPS O-acetylase OafA/YrhL